MKGHDLVNEVLREWESIVVKREVGDKMIVCGRAAKWWDKEKISLRREVYKKVINTARLDCVIAACSGYIYMAHMYRITRSRCVWRSGLDARG